MDKDTSSEPFVTSREAAKMLGVSLRTVQIWVENNVLRAWKTAGGHRRVVRNSVEDLIREQERAVSGHSNNTGLPTVLVVEDDEEIRMLYELYFSRWQLPIKLTMASNGFEGLLQIGREHPQLVITDLNMPGMDGFHMLRVLKEESALKNMELIVVTGLDAGEIKENGGLPKDIKIMQKPIDFDALQAFVTEKLNLTVSANA